MTDCAARGRRLGTRATAAATAAAMLATLAPATGHADEAGERKIATDLFDAGVRKSAAGKCDETPVGNPPTCLEARDLYRRAFKLYPAGLGALRNLASVEKSLGLTASAARSYRELARTAPLDPRKERRIWADFARKELEALEPLVPHFVVKVPDDAPADAQVTVDGETLPQAAWSVPIDVDPGDHAVRATASGYLTFESTMTAVLRETRPVPIELRRDPQAVAATTAARVPPEPAHPVARSTPGPRDLDPAPDARASGSRVAPLVLTGVGVVGLGAGLGLGLVALDKRKDACGDALLCEKQGFESAKTFADVSTIVTIAAGAAVAGGLIWYFVAPKRAASATQATSARARLSPVVHPGGGGLFATGTF